MNQFLVFHSVVFLFLLRICDSANLKMVQAIWRHGDRAPGELPYPNDKYNESFWPRGWDQLTNMGIWQGVQLGIWLRQRYGNTTLPQFNKDTVYIRSTDSERAIQTAQAVSAGLFPPTGDRLWESSYLKYWQPTPIHTNGEATVDLLRPSKVKCPNYNSLRASEEQPVALKINTEYVKLFNYLANVTGMGTIDYSNVDDLYDIQREIIHNMPQPKWVDFIFNGSTVMDHVREIKRIKSVQELNSKGKAKLQGGYLVNAFLENIENVINNQSTLEAVLYSAHDGTVSALLYALNVSDDQLVPYCATVIFELYDDNTVQLFYKTFANLDPTPLTIPGCQQSCPFEQFSQLLSDVRVRSIDELYALCGTNTVSTGQSIGVSTTPTTSS